MYICSPKLTDPVVQLVRIPACHAGGRGFESRPDRKLFRNEELFYSAQVLKLVDKLVSGSSAERRAGSSPVLGTKALQR